MSAKRTIVLADLHLVPDSAEELSGDVASLLAAHRGARLVVAGDFFDLPSIAKKSERRRAVSEVLAAHQPIRAALGEHLDKGGELVLLGGNHDAEVGSPGFEACLIESIGAHPSASARITTSPWFFREGGLHVEHGHLYDPDNAPAHPLVDGEASLGVHFTEEFLAPTGAFRYLQVNADAPLPLFLRSFSWYGLRAPYVIYRYFHAAILALGKSGPFYRAGAEVGEGRERAVAFAREAGIPVDLAHEVFALSATPTLQSFSQTFRRLYFDRVLATLGAASGLTALAFGKTKAGALLLGVSAAVMAASWAHGKTPFAASVIERLSRGAGAVAGATGAKLVVLGHTHTEALEESYANTGSFAFPKGAPGRPFLEIEGDMASPKAVRRYWG